MNTITPIFSNRYQPGPKAGQVRFAGAIGKEAIQGLVVDTLGVLVPKLVVARGEMNRTEEWVLEGLEDIAFYFAVPLSSQYLFSGLFQRLVGKLGETVSKEAIGKTLEPAARASKHLLAAKAGTLLATLSVAGAIEYLVPHVKNWVTVKTYAAKNFTAVANLDEARTELKQGESDPVEKFQVRSKQVGIALAALLAFSVLLPRLIVRHGVWEKAAKNTLKYLDFGKGGSFDMSKPILAVLALTGLGAYIDAARDDLERKEVGLRVAGFVIPYYLFGKELVGNALARLAQNFSITVDGAKKKIKDVVPFIDANLPKNSFLDFNKVISHNELVSRIEKLPLSLESKLAVSGWHRLIGGSKYFLSALLVGILCNRLAYAMTRVRFENRQPAEPVAVSRKPLSMKRPELFHSFESRQH